MGEINRTEVKETNMVEIKEKEIVEIVEKTVEQTLAKMGLNSEEIYEAQKDFMYLREQRELHEKISESPIYHHRFYSNWCNNTFITGDKSCFGN